MNRRAAAWLVRLYPRPWQARFGAEMIALLETIPFDPRTCADVVRSALIERLLNAALPGDSTMALYPRSALALARRPLGFLPMAMSLTAAAVVAFAVKDGIPHQTDEGAAAHVFQLLVAGQLPLAALFALRWMPRDAKATLTVIGGQAVALAATLMLVRWLGL